MASRTSDRIPSASFSADRVRKTCPPVSSARSRKAGGIALGVPTIFARLREARSTTCPPRHRSTQSPLLLEESLALGRLGPELDRQPTGWSREGPFPVSHPASSRPALNLSRIHSRRRETSGLELSTRDATLRPVLNFVPSGTDTS